MRSNRGDKRGSLKEGAAFIFLLGVIMSDTIAEGLRISNVPSPYTFRFSNEAALSACDREHATRAALAAAERLLSAELHPQHDLFQSTQVGFRV